MPANEWKYERPRNRWGVAAVVLAVAGLVVGVVPVAGDALALLLAVAAVLTGFRGFMRAEDGLASNPRTALAGMVIGALVALWSLVTLLAVLAE